MNWRTSISQTINLVRVEIGKVLTSWSFFVLTLFTTGFFMGFLFSEYPQRFSTDYGIIRVLIGSKTSDEIIKFLSYYSMLQLRELLSSQLVLRLFSMTYMGFNGGIFGILLVILQTCGNIARDRAQGMLLLYFSKPILRSKLLMVRFASFVIPLFILVFALHTIPLMLLASYALIPNGILLECLPGLFSLVFIGTLILTAFLLAIGSITYLFSSLTDNPSLALLGSLLVTFVPTYIGAYTTDPGRSRMDLEACLLSLYTHVMKFTPEKHTFRIMPITWYNFPQPGMAAIMLLSAIILPLLLACIIVEIREFK